MVVGFHPDGAEQNDFNGVIHRSAHAAIEASGLSHKGVRIAGHRSTTRNIAQDGQLHGRHHSGRNTSPDAVGLG